jgi:hypothetical protein
MKSLYRLKKRKLLSMEIMGQPAVILIHQAQEKIRVQKIRAEIA